MAKKVQVDKKRKKGSQVKKTKQKRKRTSREANKRPALEKRFYSKIKQLYFDIDYADTLSEKDKDYLNSFQEETLNARFNHEGKKLITSVEEKRAIYRENNKRNNDVYNIITATGYMSEACPFDVIENLQQEHCAEFQEMEDSKSEQQEIELQEKLTKSEYKKLLDSGAYIPEEIRLFYNKLYGFT